MVFACIRRIGRAFSILLLLWTTVDLIDHDVCLHRGAGAEAAKGATVGLRSSAQTGQQAPHADHSFCCSHTVDVKTPFQIRVAPLLVGFAPVDSPALPFRDPSGLYHPPLA